MAPIRVVLADDHTIVCDGLRFLLEAQRDITVVGVAANGVEAVHQVQETRPDVVIIDIAMPRLNGLDATERITAECPGTAVVVLSMFATSEHIRRALRAGARGYLLKESAGCEVVEAVRAVHAGRRHLSRQITERILDEFVDQPWEPADPLAQLSAREREVLHLVAEGRSSTEIGKAICLSPKTVDTYRSRLMRKLDVADAAGLIRFALQHSVML